MPSTGFDGKTLLGEKRMNMTTSSCNSAENLPQLDHIAFKVGRRQERLENRAVDLGHHTVGRLAAPMSQR